MPHETAVERRAKWQKSVARNCDRVAPHKTAIVRCRARLVLFLPRIKRPTTINLMEIDIETEPLPTKAARVTEAAQAIKATAAPKAAEVTEATKATAAPKAAEVNSEGGLPPRKRRAVLSIMVTGTTAACITQSMLIAALPTIMAEFAIDASAGQLLTTAYIFTLGLISALTAFLMNRFNSKKLFLASMASFAIGCIAAIFAPNYPCLLVARLVQAGGAGICLPLVQLVALNVYPKSQYGRATSIVGMIIGFAPAVGPTISGFLIDMWGWRSMFWILGAIGIAVIVLTTISLPDVVKRPDHPVRFDLASTLLYLVGFVALMVGVSLVESSGSFPGVALIIIGAGVALLFVFARRQLRIPNPLLKLACFRNRTFAVSTLLVVLSHIAFMAPSIMVPLFVQDIQGQSATISGLTILPGAIMMGIMNPFTGRYLDKHGPHRLIVAGCTLIFAGTVAFACIPASVPEWVVTVLYGVRMVGISCLMMPMTAWACTTLSNDDLAQASAITTSFRQVFGSMSASLFITAMALTSQNALGVDLAGFDFSFWLQSAVPVIALVIGLFVLPKSKKG